MVQTTLPGGSPTRHPRPGTSLAARARHSHRLRRCAALTLAAGLALSGLGAAGVPILGQDIADAARAARSEALAGTTRDYTGPAWQAALTQARRDHPDAGRLELLAAAQHIYNNPPTSEHVMRQLYPHGEDAHAAGSPTGSGLAGTITTAREHYQQYQ